MKAMGAGSLASFLAALLNVGWYILLVVAALITVCVLALPFAEMPNLTISIPVSFSMDTSPQGVSAPSLGIERAELVGSGDGIGFEYGEISRPRRLRLRGTLRFPARRDAFLAVNIGILIVGCAVGILALSQLRAVFSTLREGRPFVPANAKRIGWIALATIVGEILRAAAIAFENYYAMRHFTAEGLRFDASTDLNVFALINGLIILVIAEVFREGTRLDEEQSLTV